MNPAAAPALEALIDPLLEPAATDAEEPGGAQSLARGPAGVALLHIERAHASSGSWATAHAWVGAATTHEISAANNAGLYTGAPAISFVLHAAGADGTPRYGRALAALDAHVADLAHRRVDAALARIDRGDPPAFAEYDVFYGLTGIGQLLLEHAPGNDALGRILGYLVRLTEPLHFDGATLPGWWVLHDPDPLLPTPGGHGNFGLAHGIAGPLALLARAARQEILVDGQIEAISEICAYLDGWQQDGEPGPWWPQWISRDELRTGRVTQDGPRRPSWCYGTPGITRAQQLAAIAIGDTTRQAMAEQALAACLSDPVQLHRLTDTGLCHGWSGLYQTVWHAMRDARDPTIATRLPDLADLLARKAGATECPGPGLLDGAAGAALALHTALGITDPISGWDACPAHQLNPPTTAQAERARPLTVGATDVVDGVLAVLAGSPVDQVAGRIGMRAADLADATDTFQQAGRAALEAHAQTVGWYQVHIEFPDWAAAESTAAGSVGPGLQDLQDNGVVGAWWFIRKAPCWRVRLRPGRDVELGDMTRAVDTVLNEFTSHALLAGWRRTLYEPETLAFGGPQGIDIAHDLFCTDSRHILAYLRQPDPVVGRRELSVLLCTTLVRAAGQEWFEAGDIWHRVTQMRPTPSDAPADRTTELEEDLRRLLGCDARATGALFGSGGPLAFADAWAAAFDRAGRALATAANDGKLDRGTRSVLAHYVIFHWNRMGLPVTTQAILARAARTSILG